MNYLPFDSRSLFTGYTHYEWEAQLQQATNKHNNRNSGDVVKIIMSQHLKWFMRCQRHYHQWPRSLTTSLSQLWASLLQYTYGTGRKSLIFLGQATHKHRWRRGGSGKGREEKRERKKWKQSSKRARATSLKASLNCAASFLCTTLFSSPLSSLRSPLFSSWQLVCFWRWKQFPVASGPTAAQLQLPRPQS